MRPNSQNAKVLRWLRRGWFITPVEAEDAFGCMRLAARIKDLRDMGYKIHTDNSKGYATYTLIKEPKGAK